MLRAPNPFDTRRGHAAQRLASGGANCSTCTSTSSSVVSAVLFGALSSRMVGRAPEPEPEFDAHRDRLGHRPPALAPADHRSARMVVAALLPSALLLALFGWVGAILENAQGEAGVMIALASLAGMLALLWWALRFSARRNNSLTGRLLAVLLLLFPLVLVGEAILWMLLALS